MNEPQQQSLILENTANKEAIGIGAFTTSFISFIKGEELAFYLCILGIVAATAFFIKKLLASKSSTYQSVSVPNETLV